ncbi:type II 3-dehydroquinate dehydratase [Streptomyces beijiangensis]|uniref:3-dehydroquinate dehydratase n=2 Tax=Streptomyces beijiangensis TaxID=163361 RepID=A0A939JFU4_9ACTN|nr:type II 3-dehydroquinate dehydratase [Streptomyces beijiangensis]MBO0514501.1 type II 3-dehydroquinate dehydratase [Streptomyces beijiangensis]
MGRSGRFLPDGGKAMTRVRVLVPLSAAAAKSGEHPGAGHRELVALCLATGRSRGLAVEVLTCAGAAETARRLHEAAALALPVVIDREACALGSPSVRDALAQCQAPVIEVSPADAYLRAEHRRAAPCLTGTIGGFGLDSYRLALHAVADWVTDTARADAPCFCSASVGAPCPR